MGRFRRLGMLVRSVSYEVVIAALSISVGWRILRDPLSAVSSISQHTPRWESTGFATGLIAGGAITLIALLFSGLMSDPVKRTIGHRFEQGGQILLAGMFVAPALAAFELGSPGYVQGFFDIGISLAAVLRATHIHATFATSLDGG